MAAIQKKLHNYFTVYKANPNDGKEQQRVKSLQLICYKIANHKKEIEIILEKVASQNEIKDNING